MAELKNAMPTIGQLEAFQSRVYPWLTQLKVFTARIYLWFTELSIVPTEYHYILRMISWFFITLSLAILTPFIMLVIYDFTLWLWRLGAAANDNKRLLTSQKQPLNDIPMPESLADTSSTSPMDGVSSTNGHLIRRGVKGKKN
ncbi:hypothetical protein B0H63DRAFT_524105 [Podospora didyma]|uniref:Uncharacterized protein n=1 Tax=Podospora didyma TaxID=330526 RepID=A0AAE0NH17_9PEZI|nr:hypothetical protein B0H63DRAFT_524105 [Podospora didyma]